MTQSAAEMMDSLCQATVRQFYDCFKEFPVLETNATRILAMAGKGQEVDIAELEMVIRRDAATSGQLLRLANSAKFARGKEVQTINEAIVRVGYQEVFSLIMALATRTLFEPEHMDRRFISIDQWAQVHRHCAISGFGAGWLAKRLNISRYETAFLAGMFHDIGRLAAIFTLAQVLKANNMKPDTSGQMGRFVSDKVHVELGTYLLKKWEMPGFIVSACEFHHAMLASTDDPTLHLVRVASNLNLLADNVAHAHCRDELAASVAALELSGDLYDGIVEHMQRIRASVDALLFRS